MAAGDVTRNAIIMARTSPILWNEAPGGESYIPLHPSRRARSLAIWERTGQLLGAGSSSGPSLLGVEIAGTLDTPWGPSQIRAVVKQELASEVRERHYGGVN
jgi:hypothetical protein